MNKHIWKIDLAVILISVGVLMGIVGYSQPLVIAPLDGMTAESGNILFEFNGAEFFEIDDNLDFSSPDRYKVDNGLKLDLEPGTYYWKVIGLGSSEVRTLTIRSRVELELVEGEDSWSVVNAGNVGLNVEVWDEGELIEERKLGIGEISREGDKFVGGVNE